MNETSVEPVKKASIFKDRPIVSIIAAGLLLLLIIVYAVFPLVGISRTLERGRLGIDRSGLSQNFNPNNLPQGGTGSGGNFQQGNGTNNFVQGGRSFNANSGLARVFSILTGAFRVTVIILGLLAIVGIWLKKRWGAILAILLAVLAFALTVPAIFRPSFSTFIIIQNAAILLLAVGVLVFSILSFRMPKPQAAV